MLNIKIGYRKIKKLNSSEQNIFRDIVTNCQFYINSPIKKILITHHISKNYLTNLSKKLGFQNFKDMRIFLNMFYEKKSLFLHTKKYEHNFNFSFMHQINLEIDRILNNKISIFINNLKYEIPKIVIGKSLEWLKNTIKFSFQCQQILTLDEILYCKKNPENVIFFGNEEELLFLKKTHLLTRIFHSVIN
ncbi:RpiR family transcriptional regulator [Mycoplasma testudineum]|uniref:RpiR family transcriptional regulator n=1 Tax=Mycoplasma testudineum TaxID=244584 RepID=A0A4R6ID61_9MOLU|nr:hypothetical protein [Mycoplasma testudineum]OYD26631.1 hypothetical protein CG473_03295 [Mycoplasma testudineum]TDO19468.1 RpiR family transcriptional regulator [Mycoplasma testudineum]